MMDDAALLERYATTGANDAFTMLVRRHIDLVFATALRLTRGNTAMAEDVTQLVFIDLARKAAAASGHPALVGWLHTATRFAALRLLRSEGRRQANEQAAMTDPATAGPQDAVAWEELQPVLDDVLAKLKDRERTAILLRFFAGRKIHEVGADLALSETAARACLDRALDNMQRQLARRGITSTSTAVGLALANHVAVAAPPGLAISVTSTALVAASAGTGTVLGTVFAMSKIKTIVAVGFIAAGLTTAIMEVRANRGLRGELHALLADTADANRVERDSRPLRQQVANLAAQSSSVAELAAHRQRADTLRARPPGVIDSDFKPARSWHNAGRATPAAAQETFHWALFTGDLQTVASLVVFRDDSKENRDAFMAQCSEAVRARYATPEQVVAAGLFGVGSLTVQSTYHPDDAYQVIGQDEHVGGDGARFGQVRVRVWYHSATTGREFEGDTRWQPTPDGWALGAFVLSPGGKKSESARDAIGQLDPSSRNHVPPKK
jgi:RNA polymerase sigma factor (sigma-70 family)